MLRKGWTIKLDAAELLDALCAQLVADGASSRELLAIEFHPDGNTVQLLTGKKAHIKPIPLSSRSLRPSGRPAEDRIGAQQLRRINFLDEEIKLEVVSRSGDQSIVYAFPVED